MRFFSLGYHNGVTVHNGIDQKPSKLKQLEVQRLELGWYFLCLLHVFVCFCLFLFFSCFVGGENRLPLVFVMWTLAILLKVFFLNFRKKYPSFIVAKKLCLSNPSSCSFAANGELRALYRGVVTR